MSASTAYEQADSTGDVPEEHVRKTLREPTEPHTDHTTDPETASEGVSLALPTSSEDAVQEQAEAEVAAQVAAEEAGGDTEADKRAENPSEIAQEEHGGNVDSTFGDPAADDVDDGSGEYEESEDTLDADEVHEPSPEDGGDYAEHTEFPDDEDEFGDDLPEEFGGQTADEAYSQVEVTDDTAQYAEGDEEARDYLDDSYGAGVDQGQSILS